jgi:hypothetical protein
VAAARTVRANQNVAAHALAALQDGGHASAIVLKVCYALVVADDAAQPFR